MDGAAASRPAPLRRQIFDASKFDDYMPPRMPIDDAPVIWALDLGQIENEKLRRYYAGRSFWRFRPAESMSPSAY
jgi:hypothetical protein